MHDKFIRSLIRQLSHQYTGLPPSLVEIFGGGHQQPSIASLQLTFQRIVEEFERTYIVIDALDECTDREKVLAWIEQLLQLKAGRLHVLISSRPETDIKEHFESLKDVVRVPLAGKSADADIVSYLDATLSHMIARKIIRWDVQTVARVKKVLIRGADGMYVPHRGNKSLITLIFC